jgi:hypothetical protein
MLMFLLSVLSVAMTFCIGVLIVHAFAINPLLVLARAAQVGRYVRLGSHDLLLAVTPGTGRRRSPA